MIKLFRLIYHIIYQRINTESFSSLNKNLRRPSNGFYISIAPNIWMILVFIIPIFLVFKTSFTEPIMAVPPLGKLCTWTNEQILNIKLNVANYIRILKDNYYISTFANSVCITTLTTFICLMFGFPMAYGYPVLQQVESLCLHGWHAR